MMYSNSPSPRLRGEGRVRGRFRRGGPSSNKGARLELILPIRLLANDRSAHPELDENAVPADLTAVFLAETDSEDLSGSLAAVPRPGEKGTGAKLASNRIAKELICWTAGYALSPLRPWGQAMGSVRPWGQVSHEHIDSIIRKNGMWRRQLKLACLHSNGRQESVWATMGAFAGVKPWNLPPFSRPPRKVGILR
jgi:hypothetical protein